MEERAGGIIYCKKPLRIALARQNHQGWTFPKGHVDEGETHLQTAERECKEETGLENLKLIKEVKILNRKSRNQQTDLAISMYLFESLKPQELKEKPDSEVLEAKWFSIEEALTELCHTEEKKLLEEIKDQLLS